MKTFCSYYNEGVCRSCNIIELSSEAQIDHKELTLKNSLQDEFLLLPTITSEAVGFRNKVKLVVTGSIEQPIIGLSGEKDLDAGREILSCPLHHPKINLLLLKLRTFITDAKLQPYQIATMKGELKGFILFYSEVSDEMYLRFILRSKESVTRIIKNLSQLKNEFPHLKMISVNIQPVAHAILEGEEEIILTDTTHLLHVSGSQKMQLGPRAFVQTNQKVALKLYQTAARWTEELNIKRFSELFCGQGAFSFFAADVIEEGLGIEINPDAIVSAQQTARDEGKNHLTFKAADAADVSQELRQFAPDIVLVNPPRKGLGKSIDIFLEENYPYLIYSSCSHETLGSDFQKLRSKYEIVKSQIFDMFPHTSHFETLVLLKLRSIEA